MIPVAKAVQSEVGITIEVRDDSRIEVEIRNRRAVASNLESIAILNDDFSAVQGVTGSAIAISITIVTDIQTVVAPQTSPDCERAVGVQHRGAATSAHCVRLAVGIDNQQICRIGRPTDKREIVGDGNAVRTPVIRIVEKMAAGAIVISPTVKDPSGENRKRRVGTGHRQAAASIADNDAVSHSCI